MAKNGRNDVWEHFLGTDLTTLALPDYYANYFAYSFDRRTRGCRNIGLRINGEFAYARYMSYNIYDAKSGTSFGSLTDFQIRPLPKNDNPFVAGSDSQAKNRKYVVNILPEGKSTEEEPGNALPFSRASVDVLTVIVRYYVTKNNAPTGSVPLPRIEAFDVKSGKSVELPPLYPLTGTPKFVYRQRLHKIFETVVDDKLRFYLVAGSGQFNNADNAYLINAVERVADEVLILRIKPPTYPHNNEELDKTDVRYWSFNEGNPNTSTPFGMPDKEFKAAKDGFVYIAMGDESICRKAEQRGYNYMPWKAKTRRAVVLYRNMLTNPQYRGSLAKVQTLDLSDKKNIYHAKNHIGEYAPTGRKVSRAEFMGDHRGVASTGF